MLHICNMRPPSNGINSLESIPGLLKSLKTPPLLLLGVAKTKGLLITVGRAGYHFKHAKVEDKERERENEREREEYRGQRKKRMKTEE
jgi:hypothetical protein